MPPGSGGFAAKTCRSHWQRDARSVAVLLTFLTLISCDPDGHKQCAWVLEPEPKLIGTTTEGFIPVCARNRETMKEDCRLQTPLSFAEKAYGRKFRYVDLRVKSPLLPRTIDTIKFCDSKN